mmetsp:Transcript_14045/g.33979  ORF Transcript_14045/g.33979 Transcript_14045/m.33979 type:complete len:248 (+) Transcript_14045:1179-1922(+)
MVTATSVCSFKPNDASSSSKTHPIRTPLGPLYLNMLALPRISVASFLMLPPINSYRIIAVCTPSSLVGTTTNASGLFTSLPDFPKVASDAPVAMGPPRLIGRRLLVRTIGDVTTDMRSNMSPVVSPTFSSAPTRIRCLTNRESLRVESNGTRYANVLPDPVLPLMTSPRSLSFMPIRSSNDADSTISSVEFRISLTDSIALIWMVVGKVKFNESRRSTNQGAAPKPLHDMRLRLAFFSSSDVGMLSL